MKKSQEKYHIIFLGKNDKTFAMRKIYPDKFSHLEVNYFLPMLEYGPDSDDLIQNKISQWVESMCQTYSYNFFENKSSLPTFPKILLINSF